MHELDKEVEEILQHYGVKGMKWGVTKPSKKEPSSGGGGGGADPDLMSQLDKRKLETAAKRTSSDLGTVIDTTLKGQGVSDKDRKKLKQSAQTTVRVIKDNVKASGKRLLNKYKTKLFGKK